MSDVEKYLKKTGQTKQELFAGEFSYGFHFIVDELIPKAIKENKKIVWKTEDVKVLDLITYELIPI